MAVMGGLSVEVSNDDDCRISDSHPIPTLITDTEKDDSHPRKPYEINDEINDSHPVGSDPADFVVA